MKIVSVKDVFATILLIVSTMIIAFIELMLNEVTTNAGLLRFILKNSDKHYASWDWVSGNVGTLPLKTGVTPHEDGLVFLCCCVDNWKISFLAFNLVDRPLDCKIRIFCRPVWAMLGNAGQRTHTIWKAVKHYVEKLLLPCSSLTSMMQRSREGRGRVRRAGSESTFRLRSSERNMRTDASRGGGAWPLNCRKLSL